MENPQPSWKTVDLQALHLGLRRSSYLILDNLGLRTSAVGRRTIRRRKTVYEIRWCKSAREYAADCMKQLRAE